MSFLLLLLLKSYLSSSSVKALDLAMDGGDDDDDSDTATYDIFLIYNPRDSPLARASEGGDLPRFALNHHSSHLFSFRCLCAPFSSYLLYMCLLPFAATGI